MSEWYITHTDGEEFCIKSEERENHPGAFKTILCKKNEKGEFEKINVWKPGADSPKLPIDVSEIGEDVAMLFKSHKEKLEKAERKLGIID